MEDTPRDQAFDENSSRPLPVPEHTGVEATSGMTPLGQLALDGGEVMSHATSVLSTEDKPFARIPEDATDDEVVQHRANFARALSQTKQRVGISREEKYARERLCTYLRSIFDPRPFEEIEDNIRSIVTSELSRL